MNNDQMLDDINYASTLAREGASTPLLGGRIGLVWGILLSLVLTSQWAILSRTVNVPPQSLLYLWIAFGILGSAGSAFFGKKIDEKDGANSVSNRVEKYVWLVFSAMMTVFFITILSGILFFNAEPSLFNVVVIIGFAGQGLAYGTVAMISETKWLLVVSLASFLVAAFCVFFHADITLYLIGGIACLFTIVVPSLISIKNEQHG